MLIKSQEIFVKTQNHGIWAKTLQNTAFRQNHDIRLKSRCACFRGFLLSLGATSGGAQGYNLQGYK